MAVNLSPWKRNLLTHAPQPFRMKALFAAGSSQAIKRGEILDYASGTAVPLASDKAMAGILLVADEEIAAGDKAGYYWVIAPQPGDEFEFELAAASALVRPASLYYSTSQKLTTSGSNVLGTAVGDDHYPQTMGHGSVGDIKDGGTTVRSISFVRMTFKAAASVWATLQA